MISFLVFLNNLNVLKFRLVYLAFVVVLYSTTDLAYNAIDNGIVGEPILECDANYLTLKIRTKKHFMGRIFIKGMASAGGHKKSHEKNNFEILAVDACQSIHSTKLKSNITASDLQNKNKTSLITKIFTKRKKGFSRRKTDNSNNLFVDDEQFVDQCAMRVYFYGKRPSPLTRQRSLNPRGISVVTTIVVSFHPYFITQIDRMYRLQCFYQNSNNFSTKVKAGIQVSTLPKSLPQPTDLVMMPKCKYEILKNGPDGVPAIFSTLNTKLYHKWSCETTNPKAFCFRVHSCFAKAIDGKNTVEILDINGCAVDKFLLDNLNYSTSANRELEAGQLAPVFKYPNAESMYFQCQIKIWRSNFLECPIHICSDPETFGKLKNISSDFDDNSLVFHPKRSSKIKIFNDENLNREDIDVSADITVIEDLEKKYDILCEGKPKAEKQVQSIDNQINGVVYCISDYYLTFILFSSISVLFTINSIIFYVLTRRNRINSNS